MITRHASSRIKGYTLVEVLAVVVLMGLVFAALVPSLAGASDRARLDRLVAELIDLDARARLLAVRHGGCLIEYEADTGGVVLREAARDAGRVIVVSIPSSAGVEMQGDQHRVVFDRLGESVSYGYRITALGACVGVTFNGQSGWYELRQEDGDV